MPTAIPTDIAFGTAKSIGKYFALVSFIPSLMGVTWLFLVLQAGAPTSALSFEHLSSNLSRHGLVGLVYVFGGALAVALLTHPLQYGIVQVLEGYWSGTALGRAAQRPCVSRHLDNFDRALRQEEQAHGALDDWLREGVDIQERLMAGDPRAALMRLAEANAAAEMLARYPNNPSELMPTRLGNVLRSWELRVGRSYGLPILRFATHLGLIAEPRQTAFVQDQRNQLDLAARLCATGLFASVASFALLWPFGLWLLLSMVPFVAAYLAYRGAISAALAYGEAVGAWSDLNRFRLYEALGLPRPVSSEAERTQNTQLLLLRSGSTEYAARYRSSG